MAYMDRVAYLLLRYNTGIFPLSLRDEGRQRGYDSAIWPSVALKSPESQIYYSNYISYDPEGHIISPSTTYTDRVAYLLLRYNTGILPSL